jgi:lipoprotein-anchoring transpeptidase ErfK/SrfK
MSAFDASSPFSRRAFLSAFGSGAAALALSGCANVPSSNSRVVAERPQPLVTPLANVGAPQQMYAALVDETHQIPAVPFDKIDKRFHRQEVADPTGERPGTIVVDTSNHFLYLVGYNGRAMRYGVGLGRDGFAWAGRAQIDRKSKWPKWFPPAEMIDRQPNLEKYRSSYDKKTGEWLGGMEPGISNPLGARALYLYEDGKDTLYRIHGSPEWWSIGKSVSSGCVRMINQDVIDLYDRVPEGTPVLVTSGLRSV